MTRPAVRRTRERSRRRGSPRKRRRRQHLGTALFFEAGLNLTKSGLGGKCFSTFLGDTRSSTSLTATLFDFSGGTLGKCDSGVVTTPSVGKGGSARSAPTGRSGDRLGRSGGQRRQHIRRNDDVPPVRSDPLSDPYAPCTTGGTLVGAPKPVSGPSPTTVVSDAYTITSAGKYCWRADYSATRPQASLHPATAASTSAHGHTASAGDHDERNRAAAYDRHRDQRLGDPSGATSKPAGRSRSGSTGPNDATCSGRRRSRRHVPVTGNGDYSSGNFTPTAAGTYRWIASYTGDLPNTLAV